MMVNRDSYLHTVSSGVHKAPQLVRQAGFLFCLYSKVTLFSSLLCPFLSLRLETEATRGHQMSVHPQTLTHMAWVVSSSPGKTQRENKRHWSKAPAWHTLKQKWIGSVSKLWTATHTHIHPCVVRRVCSSGVLQCNEACEWREKRCGCFTYQLQFWMGGSILWIACSRS